MCTKLEENKEWNCEEIGSARTWGFFFNKENALEALRYNVTDMWETCYNYAILECYEEGTIAFTTSRECFKYDIEKNGYFPIETPSFISPPIGIVFG